MATDKDLFDDSTMTFGEHLEVLRFHLIRRCWAWPFASRSA